jgi:hypothetical protein
MRAINDYKKHVRDWKRARYSKREYYFDVAYKTASSPTPGRSKMWKIMEVQTGADLEGTNEQPIHSSM